MDQLRAVGGGGGAIANSGRGTGAAASTISLAEVRVAHRCQRWPRAVPRRRPDLRTNKNHDSVAMTMKCWSPPPASDCIGRRHGRRLERWVGRPALRVQVTLCLRAWNNPLMTHDAVALGEQGSGKFGCGTIAEHASGQTTAPLSTSKTARHGNEPTSAAFASAPCLWPVMSRLQRPNICDRNQFCLHVPSFLWNVSWANRRFNCCYSGSAPGFSDIP